MRLTQISEQLHVDPSRVIAISHSTQYDAAELHLDTGQRLTAHGCSVPHTLTALRSAHTPTDTQRGTQHANHST